MKRIGYPIINKKEIKNCNKYMDIVSPISNKNETSIGLLTKQDINNVYQLSKTAFYTWKNSFVKDRIEILKQWIVNIEKNKNNIANAMFIEIAKNYKSSISEINRSISYIKDTIKAFYSLQEEGYSGKNADLKKLIHFKREPLGVTLAISPFNYPINLAVSKICPALITGNTIVFKSASQASYTSYLLAKTLNETKIPNNVFNYITGLGKDIGDVLVNNSNIKLINFTGSTYVGKNIVKSNGNLCNYILEMGGKSTAIVLKDADIKKAASQIISGAFSYNGQRCTAIKRVICEEGVFNKLIDLLTIDLKKLHVGKTNDCDITPVINEGSKKYIIELTNDAIKNNSKIIGINKNEENLLYPLIIIVNDSNVRIFNEEQFGPVLPILKIKNNAHDKIISLINKSEYGLQSSIFTNNINYAIKFYEQIDTGTFNVNGIPERGPDYLPFLGVKNSGMNTQGIFKSLLSYTQLKGFVINY